MTNNEILTDQEKDKVMQFIADEVMAEAVKKVLLQAIYEQGSVKKGKNVEPLKNAALALVFKTVRNEAVITNEALGADLRAMAHGINFLEVGFDRLKKLTPKLEDINPPMNEAI